MYVCACVFHEERWKEIRKFDSSCAGDLVRNHFSKQKYLAVKHFFFLGAPWSFFPQPPLFYFNF